MKQEWFNCFNTGEKDFVTAGQQLAYISSKKPHETAITCIDKNDEVTSITWEQLHKSSNQLSWLFLNMGIKPGDIVSVMLPNNIFHVVCTFAIWKIGACYFPLCSKLTSHEYEELNKLVSLKLVISDRHLDSAIQIDSQELIRLLQKYSKDMPPDVMSIPSKAITSGGTSGKPKVIVHNIASGNTDKSLKSWFGISGQGFEQNQLVCGPIYHGAPSGALFNGLFLGNKIILMEKFKSEKVVDLIEKYKIEFIQMVPTMMHRIIKLPNLKKEKFASLKALSHTGGICSDDLKRKWIDLLGASKIYEMYSMSEMIGMTTIRGDEWLLHPKSVGRPQGCEISIRDENGKVVKPYEIGEIFMRPLKHKYNFEYIGYNQISPTKDGFKTVGDMGYIDEDGYLFFVDRRSDMIVTGGENIFTAEVEAVLLKHDRILDAVVMGIPDEEWGQRVHAIIEVKDSISEEKVKAFLKKRLLGYKIPKSIEVVNKIPRMENGKVNKSSLTLSKIAL